MALEILKIPEDTDIKKAIAAYLSETKVVRGIITGAIGSVKGMDFAAPSSLSLPITLSHTLVEGPGELLCFTGEILPFEEMPIALRAHYQREEGVDHFLHIHASVGVQGGQVLGGGMHGGKTFRGMNVFMDLSRDDGAQRP